MRLSNLLAVGLALVGSSTASWPYRWGCLSKREAKQLTEAYDRLVSDFKAEDMKYLADDWVDYSQSIATFQGKSDNVAFANPAEFQASQEQFAAAGRLFPLEITSDILVDCNKISFVWDTTFPTGVARGLTIIEAKPKWRGAPVMTRWDVEFNSLNWAVNTGGSYCLNLGPVSSKVGSDQCAALPDAGAPPS